MTHENKTLRQQYRLDNEHECELWKLFPQPYTRSLTLPKVLLSGAHGNDVYPGTRHEGTEVHHILGKQPRWDAVTNLICLCPEVHRWATQYKWDGLAMCLFVKQRKGELDLASMNLFERKNLLAWIDVHELVFPISRECRGELLELAA